MDLGLDEKRGPVVDNQSGENEPQGGEGVSAEAPSAAPKRKEVTKKCVVSTCSRTERELRPVPEKAVDAYRRVSTRSPLKPDALVRHWVCSSHQEAILQKIREGPSSVLSPVSLIRRIFNNRCISSCSLCFQSHLEKRRAGRPRKRRKRRASAGARTRSTHSVHFPSPEPGASRTGSIPVVLPRSLEFSRKRTLPDSSSVTTRADADISEVSAAALSWEDLASLLPPLVYVSPSCGVSLSASLIFACRRLIKRISWICCETHYPAKIALRIRRR